MRMATSKVRTEIPVGTRIALDQWTLVERIDETFYAVVIDFGDLDCITDLSIGMIRVRDGHYHGPEYPLTQLLKAIEKWECDKAKATQFEIVLPLTAEAAF